MRIPSLLSKSSDYESSECSFSSATSFSSTAYNTSSQASYAVPQPCKDPIISFSTEELQPTREYLVNRVWRLRSGVTVAGREGKVYLFRFNTKEDLNFVWQNGPWSFEGALMAFELWRKNTELHKFHIQKIPLWVQFGGLPLEYHQPLVARRLAETIGTVTQIDWRPDLSTNQRLIRVRIYSTTAYSERDAEECVSRIDNNPEECDPTYSERDAEECVSRIDNNPEEGDPNGVVTMSFNPATDITFATLSSPVFSNDQVQSSAAFDASRKRYTDKPTPGDSNRHKQPRLSLFPEDAKVVYWNTFISNSVHTVERMEQKQFASSTKNLVRKRHRASIDDSETPRQKIRRLSEIFTGHKKPYVTLYH
ncbi:hypothetical protein PTKIN_Ptkin01aG0124700 [Pterospermum kingtungense]